MDWLLEPLSQSFLQRALVAGVLAVLTTSVVGTWVVLRGLSFLGDALAHGMLPGIALGVLLGFDVRLGAVASVVVMTGGIALVHRRARLSEDTGIGLLFVGMLALGVVLISRLRSYTGSLTSILFGDPLAASVADLWVLGAGAGLAVAVSVVAYRPFLTLAFHEAKAEALGLHPQLAHQAMLALVTVGVVVSFQTVGSLLVFGLLVAPPATAALVVRRMPVMMAASVGLGILAVAAGLLISYHLDTAASATMAGVSVGLFFLVLLTRRAAG